MIDELRFDLDDFHEVYERGREKTRERNENKEVFTMCL